MDPLVAPHHDYVGRLVGYVGPQSSWFPGPALCGCCCHWLVGLDPEATDCGTQGALGLVLPHWWAESRSSRLRGCCLPTGGETKSWGLVPDAGRQSQLLESGCRDPRASVSSQVTGKFLTQLGPVCLEARVVL